MLPVKLVNPSIPLTAQVVEVMTAITDKLSEMSDNSGFQLVNEEYTMSDDSLPNIMVSLLVKVYHNGKVIIIMHGKIYHVVSVTYLNISLSLLMVNS